MRSTRDDDADDARDEEPSVGWRPIGEAAFWGSIFVVLTLVAFGLGEGLGKKDPVAQKPAEGEANPPPVETPKDEEAERERKAQEL
ncbi:MAG TPA: hypothetical protein VNC50_17555, partial [Planctomycetia bacterium]|nr:hypothetical protein [Planctomycetia bacterium]